MNIQIPDTLDWTQASAAQRTAAVQRPPMPDLDISNAVKGIITQVREGGDKALRQLTRDYDGVELESLEVSPQEWAAAESAVDVEVLGAMDEAIGRIDSFHRAGIP